MTWSDDQYDWPAVGDKASRSAEFYHYAPTHARHSIATHGIDYTRGPHAHTPLVVANTETGEDTEVPRANYFYTSAASARDAIPARGKHDIYRVHGEGLNVHTDPYEDAEAVYTHERVPPHRIERLK